MQLQSTKALTGSGANPMLSTSCSPTANSHLSPSQDSSPGFCIFCFCSHTCPHPLRRTHTWRLILHGLYGLSTRKLAASTCVVCGWSLSSKGQYSSCSPRPRSPILPSTFWDFWWPSDLCMSWSSLSLPDTSDKIKWRRQGRADLRPAMWYSRLCLTYINRAGMAWFNQSAFLCSNLAHKHCTTSP